MPDSERRPYHSPAPVRGERRRAVRVESVMEIRYGRESSELQARLEDLSEVGAYVDTLRPLPAGSVVEFEFRLPEQDEGEPIEGRARICRSEPMVGMALEFLRLSDEDRQRIRRYVAARFLSEA